MLQMSGWQASGGRRRVALRVALRMLIDEILNKAAYRITTLV
jgi:hypothetical protein